MEYQISILKDYLVLFIMNELSHDQIIKMIKQDICLDPETKKYLSVYYNNLKK